MGFRYKVGGDTLTYMMWFEWAKDLSSWNPLDIIGGYEPGFTFLAALAKSLGGEFFYLQLIHAFILNTCIFVFISNNTKYRFTALLIALLTYYIYFSTEVLREAIAVMIFTLNFKSYVEKKWLRYYVGVIVCIFFHLSASFLLILPIFSNLRFNYKFAIVFVCFVLTCFLLRPLFSLLSTIVPILGEKASSYSEYSFVGYFWAGLRVFQFSLIPFLFLIFCKKIFHAYPQFEISYLVMILLGVGVIFSPIIFQRFTNYFYPLYALSIADVISHGIVSVNNAKKMAALMMGLLITIGYGSYFFYLDAYKMWVPYSSVFNPQEYSFRQKFANGGHG